MLERDEERPEAGPDAAATSFVAARREAPPWDSELFLLRGPDRRALIDAVRRLQDFLQTDPGVNLKDLAFTLNTAPAGPGSACLALVAGSAEQLQARLASAAGRLADPERTQIKDAAGIYYVDRPLHPEGSLALLFPGEGGEYLNMLADLCPHFPEVGDAFAKAEHLAWNASPAAGQRFARLFRFDPAGSAQERQEAEQALVQLDAIASGVLLADWAMFALLTALGLTPAAMAGHSLGEIAALQACGAIEGSEEQLVQVGAVLNQLASWEAAGAITPSMLLAVGAGRPAVEQVVQDAIGGGVFLAMDNCPHQTIAVGPLHLMEPVQAELKARGFICERLPFDVPYHTPMFEPYLGPFRELFDGIPFRRPRSAAIYSFSTGRPFPDDPAEIRDQALLNLARPVEFTSLIRNMHADGVRLFVECGPRGNLTSFVEDILRNERFAAIPSNLPTRSGVTQLNHLAGQLASHGAPLKLEHLYGRRSPQHVAWDRAPEEEAAAPADAAAAEQEVSPAGPLTVLPPAARPHRAEVVAQHLALMEQFLDSQVDVMGAYLNRRRGSARGEAPARAAAFPPGPAPLPWPTAVPDPIPVALAQRTAPPPLGDLPLLATSRLLSFEPGREIAVRRPLDLAEDLFASHHTVGGHAVSKVDPDQHGLAVMPMTFSLEIMAELAACLVPGFKAIGIENVRLFHWLAFDADEIASIEASARLLADPPADPGAAFQVALEIHVVGGAANTALGRSPAGQGVVLLAAEYPPPPPAGEFPLTDEHACTIPVEVLYRNLFHGPLLQGTRSCGRSGNEGLEGEIEILPRDRLLRSQPAPRFAMDPVTLDVGMHPISAWHLEFEDQSGRVLLPVELKKIELFGPQLAPGTRLTSRCFAHGGSYRHFSHSVDLSGPDGRLWSRMSNLTFWRFYVPFAEVNFFGPKDEYFISKPWDVGLANSAVSACCIRLDTPPDQKQKQMRIVTSKVTLSPGEMVQYRALGGDEPRETSWLFGRLAAKDAVRHLWHAHHGERLFPTDIIITGDEGGPLVAHPRGKAEAPFPNVAVTRVEDVFVSVAAFGAQVGAALERIGPPDPDLASSGLTEAERALLGTCPDDPEEWVARLSAAKSAIGTALRGGPDGGPEGIEVRAVDWQTGLVTAGPGPAWAGREPAPRPDELVAHTARQGDLIVAVCLSERPAA
ncbi:acyltransferase domain-containing protein [Enterovirga sp.]|uniref:acyltransferase domain-containing protein n=1 Tax=Enterovirga sp. TaxID=2026350 RepID=UPI00262D25CA|nr:acyltransferase domain-containing protein [Enterovirga sp.]MDB5592195.1 beta-ketoacyl synthase [Enterovirga sp.]